MTAPEPGITKYVKKKGKKRRNPQLENPIGYPNPTPLSPPVRPPKPLTELKALNVVLLGVV